MKVSWSVPAAARALRAMIVLPGLFALCFKILGDVQVTVYAVFGGFGALIFTSFGGSRRDKAVAHLGLALAGSLAIVIGTLVSGTVWVAAIVTIPVAFAIFFAGVAGPNAAGGVTAVLLAYVLPVASAGSAGVIPARLAGWWLASAVSTVTVLLFSPHSAGDELRTAAGRLAAALARHLDDVVAGTATAVGLEYSRTARRELMNRFASTPYRPTGLASADQAVAGVIHMLDWCTALTCDAVDGQLDLAKAAPPDKRVLTQAATELRAVAELLTGRQASIDLRQMWQARTASALQMRQLTGDQATLRRQVGYAYHAQAIGLAASAAGADAMIAAGQATREAIAVQRQHWVDGLPLRPDGSEPQRPRLCLLALPGRLAELIATDANSRSVWFRNSARGAIALAGAVAVARLTRVQHGFWVVLGTLSVLRTSAATTGSTAVRALAGTLAGFAIGGLLLAGIGTSQAALLTAFPIAVLIAAYAPGTAPFAVGQAAFTVAIVVLFNLLVQAGWQVGLVRFEDVALGCAVSAAVGILFWPRGAAAVVGDNLAVALRSGADYLTESARCALDLGRRHTSHARTAIAAGGRLDDAVRGYLTEQGSKRLAKADLWMLVMASQRIRLTAHSLASLPVREHRPEAGAGQASAALELAQLDLTAFYDRIAAQVGPPGNRTPGDGQDDVTEIEAPASQARPASADPDTLWVRMHLEQLRSHAAGLAGPAAQLARLRRTPWWRTP